MANILSGEIFKMAVKETFSKNLKYFFIINILLFILLIILLIVLSITITFIYSNFGFFFLNNKIVNVYQPYFINGVVSIAVILSVLIVYVLSIIFLNKLSIAIVKKQKISFKTFFSAPLSYLKFIAIMLFFVVAMIIVATPSLLIQHPVSFKILTAFILELLFIIFVLFPCYGSFYIVLDKDNKIGIFKALKISWEIIYHNYLKFFLFLIIVSVLQILFSIGSFLTLISLSMAQNILIVFSPFLIYGLSISQLIMYMVLTIIYSAIFGILYAEVYRRFMVEKGYICEDTQTNNLNQSNN